MEDVTERKAAAEQLRVALKMEAVGRLAGGVAHDFNNLLAVILGNTAFALETTGDGEPARADLLEIKAAAEQATAVTRQLLTFSRKNVLDAEVLDLNQVTADLLRMLRRLIGEHIELGHVAAPDLGLVMADAGQIEQALLNLALNARDAMPDDGTLTIKTANVDIDPRDAARSEGPPAGRYVRIAVTDTGSGMDEATLERVFEPFFTTKERGRGTGFGLAAVYGIVKQSGGHIGIQSRLGRGTTVEVLLPRLTKATPRVVRRPLPAQPPGGTETILVVEDERAMRALTARILGSAGYNVLLAANGEDAVLAANRHGTEVALVLTDVAMPRMNGPVLVERLKQVCPTTEVLYMSGYSDDALVDRGVLAPGVALIHKPFTADELLLRVRELLDSQPSRSLAG